MTIQAGEDKIAVGDRRGEVWLLDIDSPVSGFLAVFVTCGRPVNYTDTQGVNGVMAVRTEPYVVRGRRAVLRPRAVRLPAPP